jgi:hypothetical protein
VTRNPAGIEMKSAGQWIDGNRQRLKFRCPLKTSKKIAAQYDHVPLGTPSGACPAKHPLFDTARRYGCTKYLDVTNDARAQVPRDSKNFKETFKDRELIEQYFSRLGDGLAMAGPQRSGTDNALRLHFHKQS